MTESLDDIPFMRLKRLVIENGVDRKEANNTTTKHALLALAEKNGVSLNSLLAPGAAAAAKAPSQPAKTADPAKSPRTSAASELRNALLSPRSAEKAAVQEAARTAAAEEKARREAAAEAKAKRDAADKARWEAEAADAARREAEAKAKREAEVARREADAEAAWADARRAAESSAVELRRKSSELDATASAAPSTPPPASEAAGEEDIGALVATLEEIDDEGLDPARLTQLLGADTLRCHRRSSCVADVLSSEEQRVHIGGARDMTPLLASPSPPRLSLLRPGPHASITAPFPRRRPRQGPGRSVRDGRPAVRHGAVGARLPGDAAQGRAAGGAQGDRGGHADERARGDRAAGTFL